MIELTSKKGFKINAELTFIKSDYELNCSFEAKVEESDKQHSQLCYFHDKRCLQVVINGVCNYLELNNSDLWTLILDAIKELPEGTVFHQSKENEDGYSHYNYVKKGNGYEKVFSHYSGCL